MNDHRCSSGSPFQRDHGMVLGGSHPRYHHAKSLTSQAQGSQIDPISPAQVSGVYSTESYRGVPASSDRGGSRTHDLRIKSPLLYQLSYPVWRAENR